MSGFPDVKNVIMRILFWKFLSHYRYVLGKCEVLGKCNEYTCIPIPMNNHSQTRPNYCISSFLDAKKKKDKDEYSVLPFSLPVSIKDNKKYLEKMH